MYQRHREIAQQWREQPGLFYGYATDVGSAIALGLVLIFDAPSRSRTPVFAVINESGGPVVWGAVFLVAALLLVLAALRSSRALMVTLWGGALLYTLLALFFGYAASISPDASHIGLVVFLRAAVTHVTRSDVYRHGPDQSPE